MEHASDQTENLTSRLAALESDEASASEEMLPLVYNELRKLASRKLRHESSEMTLQTTALVHEAYLRLVDSERPPEWDSRGHFFVAAAESMRRILVDRARKRNTQKAGGDYQRVQVDLGLLKSGMKDEQLVALDDALCLLEEKDARKAQIVGLRFFAGLTMQQAASALGISIATAERDWTYSKTWLLRQIKDGGQEPVHGESKKNQNS